MADNAFTSEELFSDYIKDTVAGNSKQIPEFQAIRNSKHRSGGDFVFQRQ